MFELESSIQRNDVCKDVKEGERGRKGALTSQTFYLVRTQRKGWREGGERERVRERDKERERSKNNGQWSL